MATPKGKKGKRKGRGTPKGKKGAVPTPKATEVPPADEENVDAKASSSSKQATITTADSSSTRGITQMHHVIVKKALGRKVQVQYNTHGVTVGQARQTLASYIGVKARTTVPIIEESWPKVDKDLKKKIWEDVEVFQLYFTYCNR